MRRTVFILFVSILILSLSGCFLKTDGPDMERKTFTQISQEEAKDMMAKEDCMIVDVRTREEYDSGHIPNAICIPNESIADTQPADLPDMDQMILVYCRSGRRSKEAAGKLVNMGYTKIYEFGGIIDWTGDIVTDNSTTVDEATTETEKPESIPETKLLIGKRQVPVTWEDNASVDALKELLPLTIPMSMYEDFEQVGPIGQAIPSDDQEMSTDYGDIVLYSGDQIVLFYGSNSWEYTKLGHIDLSKQEMTDLLGNGDVEITITEE